jgi:hypothetical protein
MAGADFDTAMPFGHPASFAWDEPDAVPVGDARLDANPFFLARLHGSVERAFAERGIRLNAEHPSLLVHHHAVVRDRVDVLAADRSAGYTETSYGPGTQVYQYEEGTFLVDVVDAKTNQVVWRGWATTDLAGALGDPKLLAELVDQSIVKMFGHFPIAIGTPPVFEPPVILPPVEENPWPNVATNDNNPRYDIPPQ